MLASGVMSFDPSPLPAPSSVTSETVDAAFPELPRLVRLALQFGSKLQRGTLDVTLADGRMVRLGGNGPGPAAAMNIYDYSFASRLVRSGDIGIAEAYLRGEWDTPDLTQFLYLFCVNHAWVQTMLAGTPLTRTIQFLRHWLNRNTRRQARRGTRVVGLTISKKQRDFAQARIQAAGLGDRVEIRLQDY